MENVNETLYQPLANNLMHSGQVYGGIIALQGIYRSIPVLHSAQGCIGAIQTVLSRHYREPIPIEHIPKQAENGIIDDGERYREIVQMVMSKHSPDVMVVIETALSEVMGEAQLIDVVGDCYKKIFSNRLLLGMQLPDDEGSLESGYARTAHAVMMKIIEMTGKGKRKLRRNRINLLPSSHLTPGDVMELKEIIASFGIEVIVLPDLSSSLTGHLMTGYTTLSRGGVPLDYLKEMINSAYTIVIGKSMEFCGRLLYEEMKIPYIMFNGVTGLQESDEFILFLRQFSQSEGHIKYRWERQLLLDCMLDTRSLFRGKTMVASLEPDHLVSLYQCLSEMGMKSFQSVISAPSQTEACIPGVVRVGDLHDLEKMAVMGSDLWVSNGYGEAAARKHNIPYIPLGFPVFNRFGSPINVSVGYRGTANRLNHFGNVMNKTDVF
ncbi:nitrogenase molybdenum-iron protein NifN [Fontibacillus panacisegetis]|uniref:Nitrogenase molybdenum-iron protein NifN n=1 Tax=Fontibacillus panacisegetis TaxID=670482 RepID=A0A1G7E898_9BACL|nr:nitrogenase component 1 [Fontibacillus panacisegetis]SDE59710.1 nitrogenase molybdenum-iron protein NifN [Fontibacillus panacisegetis]